MYNGKRDEDVMDEAVREERVIFKNFYLNVINYDSFL